MNLSDLRGAAEAFGALGGAALAVEFGRAWHFTHSYRESQVDFAKLPGVYIYTEPNVPKWDIPFESNHGAVWYIGKSDGNLAGRVWDHVGLIYDPATGGKECVPRFKYHQWADQASVPQSIRDSVANGNIVMYTIRAEPLSTGPSYAEALEKYLLAVYYRTVGVLPPLNSIF